MAPRRTPSSQRDDGAVSIPGPGKTQRAAILAETISDLRAQVERLEQQRIANGLDEADPIPGLALRDDGTVVSFELRKKEIAEAHDRLKKAYPDDIFEAAERLLRQQEKVSG